MLSTKIVFVVLFSLLCLGYTHDNISLAQAAEVEMQQRQAEIAQHQEQSLQQELTCLARNIYFESASEPYRGKVAVAQVTVNRMHSGNYPSTICGVVHQKTHTQSGTICQFSWVCVNTSIRAPALYAESRRVARQVLIEGIRLPELKNAMFFHADYIDPKWKKKPKARIGRHIFY